MSLARKKDTTKKDTTYEIGTDVSFVNPMTQLTACILTALLFCQKFQAVCSSHPLFDYKTLKHNATVLVDVQLVGFKSGDDIAVKQFLEDSSLPVAPNCIFRVILARDSVAIAVAAALDETRNSGSVPPSKVTAALFPFSEKQSSYATVFVLNVPLKTEVLYSYGEGPEACGESGSWGNRFIWLDLGATSSLGARYRGRIATMPRLGQELSSDSSLSPLNSAALATMIRRAASAFSLPEEFLVEDAGSLSLVRVCDQCERAAFETPSWKAAVDSAKFLTGEVEKHVCALESDPYLLAAITAASHRRVLPGGRISVRLDSSVLASSLRRHFPRCAPAPDRRRKVLLVFDLSTPDLVLFDGGLQAVPFRDMIFAIQTQSVPFPSHLGCASGAVVTNPRDASCAALHGVVDSAWSRIGQEYRDFLQLRHQGHCTTLPFFLQDAPARAATIQSMAAIVSGVSVLLQRFSDSGQDLEKVLSQRSLLHVCEIEWTQLVDRLAKAARYASLNSQTFAMEQLSLASHHATTLTGFFQDLIDDGVLIIRSRDGENRNEPRGPGLASRP